MTIFKLIPNEKNNFNKNQVKSEKDSNFVLHRLDFTLFPLK